MKEGKKKREEGREDRIWRGDEAGWGKKERKRDRKRKVKMEKALGGMGGEKKEGEGRKGKWIGEKEGGKGN